MQTIKENEEINKKIAQIKDFLDNKMIRSGYDVASVIERIDNINYKVLETNYLKSKHTKWIGCTALHFAADQEDLEALNILLNYGADFTIQNNDSLTVLHKIIDDRLILILNKFTLTDPYICSVLAAHLKNKNFQNPVNNSGLSHFHIACAANNLEMVRGFINSGVSIDDSVKKDSSYFAGFSPLHFAARFCAFDVADLLLSHDAYVHLKDAKGLTPLHVALERKIKIINDTDSSEAVREANEKILMMLLNKEKNDSALTIDNYGLSHLHVSCTLKDSKVAEDCLQNNGNINSIVSIDSPLWPGYTALHFTALCNIDTVKLLLKRGADVNIKNAKGLTPFDICIERYKAQEIYAILSLKPIWKNITLSDGKTKLLDLVSAMRSHDNFSKFLRRITKKVINSLPSESPLWPGYTPMHLAVIFSKTNVKESIDVNLETLKILHKQSPTMFYSQDAYGQTPLHLAFRLNKKLVLELLMDFWLGCPNLIDRVDVDGLSFVHIASAKNQIVLLQRLLAMNSNVNAIYRGKPEFSPTIYRGSTALHFAVANKSAEAIGVLINSGADAYARDANGMTPIHLLFSCGTRRKTADVLLSLPNLQDSVVSDTGLSHLHVASWCDIQEKNVERLLENGADINGLITVRASTNDEPNKWEFVEKFAGRSPLVIASQEFNTATISVLVKRGADCFIKNNNGSPWLYSLIEDGSIYDIHCGWRWFMEAFKGRDDVQARVKADTGMTPLHVACLCRNIENVQKLLSEGANVDERIRSNSPIFQGYTPLHIVIRTWKLYEAVRVNEKILNLLLKAGGDVTLQSSDSKTVIHMAYELKELIYEELCSAVVNTLLEAQQDFSVNPTDVGGISHFLIACHVCNASVVENFLECDDLGVNQKTDYFHDEKAGCSALHLVAGSNLELCGIRKLRTLDILLKHGADVGAEDFYGETPLHECARSLNSIESLDLFERLVRGGSNVDARNVYGQTSMDVLKEDLTSAGMIRNLLRFGCRFNSFNTVDGSGSVGRMSNSLAYEDLRSLICAVNVNFAREMKVDSVGRTIIHNLVSTVSSNMLPSEYPELIEHISRTGHDVDDQDKLGRTALHMAAKFHNFHAVSGLLMAGADINISDKDGKTAFASIFDSCMKCACDDGDDNEDNQMCKHQKTIATLANHINKLKIFKLYVAKKNEDLAFKVCEKFESGSALNEDFFKELEVAKNTRIGSYALTLYNFLAEDGAVADFPRMLIEKRQAVNKFFSANEMTDWREKFPELGGILQLQYRKARARPQLVESAQNALTICAGFRLPEICSDFILILLRNSDLKNLIASTLECDNSK